MLSRLLLRFGGGGSPTFALPCRLGTAAAPHRQLCTRRIGHPLRRRPSSHELAPTSLPAHAARSLLRRFSSVAAPPGATVARGAAWAGKRTTPLSTVLWRCLWVPYAVLSIIPHTFLAITLYHLARGDRAKARGWAFYALTGYICLPLSVGVNLSFPAVYLFDWDRRMLYNYITKLWGKITTWPFVVPVIRGVENVPGTVAAAKAAAAAAAAPASAPEGSDAAAAAAAASARVARLADRPVIFVSNHQSWLDIFCLCWLPDDVILRFISKVQIAYIPVVGWSMALLGHVLFDRRTGGKQLLADCAALLDKRVPVFFFAEGTRSRDPARLLPFKIGAFKLARDAGAVIVPVTVQGTGAIMRVGSETELHLETAPATGNGGGQHQVPQVTITIHEPIAVEDGDTAESLRDRTAASISSALVGGGEGGGGGDGSGSAGAGAQQVLAGTDVLTSEDVTRA